MRLILTAALALAAVSAGCRKADHAAHEQSGVWQCPMHPEIVRDKPGDCPICGMALVKVDKPEEPASEAGDRADVTVSAQRRQLIGVTTGQVELRDLERRIDAPARVAYDPGLYAAIEEHRQALAAGGGIARSTRMKLRLLGLSDAQVDQLSRGGSASGLVLGQAGSSVWVYAEIYEADANLVKPGHAVELTTPALAGERFETKVASIDPVINPVTRTARARALLANPHGRFRPEMYLKAQIRVPLGRKLAVPRDAVLDTGDRQLVFVDRGEGRLEPREVSLGEEAGDWRVVRSGLSVGEAVVTSANFLIDSESRSRAAARAFHSGH